MATISNQDGSKGATKMIAGAKRSAKAVREGAKAVFIYTAVIYPEGKTPADWRDGGDIDDSGHYPTSAKAVEAALERWPHAYFDIDYAVECFERKIREEIPDRVKRRRAELHFQEDVRHLADREGISKEAAEKRLKAEAKAARQAAKDAANSSEDVFEE
tara:strand:+ start:330 stop:806 length:477 start_codon:yes stop_codon:yes gene_type:complete